MRKDERKYYEELLKYSRDHLMLYPYHLSDIMVKGLRVTPFSYYIGIMEVSNHYATQLNRDGSWKAASQLLVFYHILTEQLHIHLSICWEKKKKQLIQ